MGVVLAFLIALVLLEIAVLIQVGQWLGVLNTLGLLILISVVGAYLVKRQGIGLIRRVLTERREGRVPTAPIADGALLALAGVLLVTPGFVTDGFGLLLLLPPVRAGVRAWLRRRWSRRIVVRRLEPGP